MKINSKIKLLISLTLAIVIAGGFFVYRKFDHKQVSTASVVEPKSEQTKIPGWWYQKYFGFSVCSQDICKPDADPDHDGLTNQQEYYYHADPMNAHTAGDALNDGEMVAQGFDPSKKGRVTFSQSASDDNVVGESLVFDRDIKNLITDVTQINNAQIPQVSASLNFSNINTKQSLQNYFNQIGILYAKYFPENQSNFLADAISQGDSETISAVKLNMQKMESELETMPVPSSAEQLQRYHLALMQVVPLIVNVPSKDQLESATDNISNGWYDNVKTYSLLVQRIQMATKLLKDKYGIN